MGLRRRLRKNRKKLKKAEKDITKAANKTAQTGEMAAKATAGAGATAFHATEQAFCDVGSFALKMSREAEEISGELYKKMQDFGEDIEKAIENAAIQKMFQRLAEQTFKDNAEVIKNVVQAAKTIGGCASNTSEIETLIKDIKSGKLGDDREKQERLAQVIDKTGIQQLIG